MEHFPFARVSETATFPLITANAASFFQKTRRQIKSDLVNTSFFAYREPLRCLESSAPEFPGFAFFFRRYG